MQNLDVSIIYYSYDQSSVDWIWMAHTTCILCNNFTVKKFLLYILYWINYGSSEGGILYLDLQLPVQSVSITTNVVSLNPAHGEVFDTT